MPEPPSITSSGGVRQGTLRPASEVDIGGLVGLALTFVRIDHSTRLQFGPVEVVIEGEIRLDGVSSGRSLLLRERGELGPLLEIYPDALCSAQIDADGTLRLGFSRGAVLSVAPDGQYEPWQIVGPGPRLIVCTPGGSQLALWN